MELGNELLTSHIPLKRFHDLLSQRMRILCDIQVNVVQVVDHLGRHLSVPIVFCSTWKVVYTSTTCPSANTYRHFRI